MVWCVVLDIDLFDVVGIDEIVDVVVVLGG